MNAPTYTQVRRGSFYANIVPRGQCGFTVGQHRFDYEVSAKVSDLDDHGWVLDNLDVDKLFDAWRSGKWKASCEDLAGGGVCLIIDALGDRLEEVKCTIAPNGLASLTCEWKRGDDRPAWCPLEYC